MATRGDDNEKTIHMLCSEPWQGRWHFRLVGDVRGKRARLRDSRPLPWLLSRLDAEQWLLDEMAKRDEARQARRKKRRDKDTDASGWQFVPATEPLQGPVVPEWKQRETSAGTNKC